MPSSKLTYRESKRRTAKVGLLAFGTSGAWDIAVDETIRGRSHWFLQFDGPDVFLYFEIPTLEMIQQLLVHLRDGNNTRRVHQNGSRHRHGRLVISKPGATTISLIRDDENPTRYFVGIEHKENMIAQIAIHGEDVQSIIHALIQIKVELGNQD